MAISNFMKDNRNLSLFVIAAFLGLIAAGLSLLYLKNREEALRLKYQKKPDLMITVAVPKRDLFPGEAITTATVASYKIPRRYVPDDVITSANFKSVKGRRLQYPASEGKPIPLAHLSGITTQDFSDNITVGRRAVTIKVDTVNSLDGMLRPGNHIDILVGMAADEAMVELTTGLDGAGSEEVIFPILENVVVMATGDDDLNEMGGARPGSVVLDKNFSTITLDLYPEQVAILKSAEDVGRLIASLRNRKDKGSSGFDSVRPSQLFSLMKKARNAAKARASTTVAVDANGNPIGKIVGDTVYDEQGNVIGKVNANGDIVDVNGKVIGKKQEAQIALGVDGKPIGTIVGDKVYDENGNLIGRVDSNGRIVDNTGKVIGNASTGVAVDKNGNVIGNVVDGVVYDENGNVVGRIDENGNVVDNNGQVLGSTVSKMAIGKDGKPIGKIVGDKVYDENGKLVGRVDANGNVVDLNGKVIGEVRDNVRQEDLAVDANGNVIGRIDKDGNVIDKFGNVVGRVDENGNVVDLEGNTIGTVVKDALVDAQGNLIANEVLDANGNVLGKAIGDKVYDEEGNLIGRLDENGNMIPLEKVGTVRDNVAIGKDGKVLGTVVDGKVIDENGNVVGFVDENGNVIQEGEPMGKVVGDKAYDDDGNLIGTVVDGKVYDEDGNLIGRVDENGQIVPFETVGKVSDNVAVDENGNVLGKIVDGKVIDEDGNVVGYVDENGNIIKEGEPISTTQRTGQAQSPIQAGSATQDIIPSDEEQSANYDSIVGGNADKGVLKLETLPLEQLEDEAK